MAKLEPSGVLVKPPPIPGGRTAAGKVRRFPWRLWLWALLMTAAAGAGGYFTWHFKSKADDAVASELEMQRKSGEKDSTIAARDKTLADKTKEAADCATKRDELDKTNKTLGEQYKTNQGRLEELAKILKANEEQIKQGERFEKAFKKMIDSNALKVTRRHGNLVLSLPANILFASGVADLSEEGKIKVYQMAPMLNENGPRDEANKPNARYLVVGHTDSDALNNSVFKDNLELSTARALTVTRELVRGGMDPKALVPAGAGEADPLVPNNSVNNKALNRRIEIILLPPISDAIEETKLDKKPEKRQP